MDRFSAVLNHLEWAGLEPGDVVLDWGCGTGAFSEMLPDGVTYIGADISPAMIDRARQKHPGRQFYLLPSYEGYDSESWRASHVINYEIPGPIDHIVAIGTWNLDPRLPDVDIAMLLRKAKKSFVGSFLAKETDIDSDIEHTTYSRNGLLRIVDRIDDLGLVKRWVIHKHRHNDYILRLQH